MGTSTKINGLISFASNSPGISTGYGQQAGYLVNNMLSAGMKVASMSNFGQEGTVSTLKLKRGSIPHYPRSFQGYSVDVLPTHHNHFKSKHPNLKDAIFILYDSWVYNGYPDLDKENVIIWAPIDHITLPPRVIQFLQKENVTTIAMSPDGRRQLEAAGIESTYIPHTVDTSIYKPTFEINGRPVREHFQCNDDNFIVGMVAANKSNGLVHRKAFSENILAFSAFQRKHPEARLYIHSEASKSMGGFDLVTILKSCGIPQNTVIFPDPYDYRYGIDQKDMAAIYTGIDVLLAPSYGEGFGCPTIEAQACGTRTIVSNWAASQDLVSENSWKVEGQPFWDEPQSAWFKIPYVDAITAALEEAYSTKTGVDKKSIEFAKQFDDSKVWKEKWVPFLTDYFDNQE